jgi:hypothetical protein
MIDPTEELAQEQRRNDAIARRARAGIKSVRMTFEPGGDDLWRKEIESYLIWLREKQQIEEHPVDASSSSWPWGWQSSNLPRADISDADYMAMWQAIIAQEQQSGAKIDEGEEMAILD